MRADGAVNGDVFAAYPDQVLGPTLRPGEVVVLDNLAVHKVAGLDQIAQKYGVRLRYLPPYSPDFNPIELAFSKLKTWLRTAKARTRDALEEALLAAAAWITEQDAKDWVTIAVIMYSNLEIALSKLLAHCRSICKAASCWNAAGSGCVLA